MTNNKPVSGVDLASGKDFTVTASMRDGLIVEVVDMENVEAFRREFVPACSDPVAINNPAIGCDVATDEAIERITPCSPKTKSVS